MQLVAARAALEVDVGRDEVAAGDPARLLDGDPARVVAAAIVGGVEQRGALGGGAVGRVADGSQAESRSATTPARASASAARTPRAVLKRRSATLTGEARR